MIPLDWPIMMEFGILKLIRGRQYTKTEKDLETALIILSGSGDISIPSISEEQYEVQREHVFDEPTTSFMIPKNHEYIINTRETLEVAVVKAKDEGSEFLAVSPEDLQLDSLGDEKNNSRRRVFEYFGHSNVPHSNIVLGESLSEEGGHTGVGPFIGGAHKHPQWEFYYKKLEPKDGYTWIGMGKKAYYGFNNTITLIAGDLPHPQCAGYGTREWNLWGIRHHSGNGGTWTRESCEPVKISLSSD